MAGPLCQSVLCPLWLLKAAGLVGGGREKGMALGAWILHPERGIAGVMLCSSPHTWATT